MNQSLLPANPARVMPISPGIAIGPARIYRTASPALIATKIAPHQVEAEQQRLSAAIAAALQELQELQAHVAKTVGRNEAAIFEAQQLMLQDPDLIDEANESISSRLFSAGAALQDEAERLARELEALANETLAARAADVRDVTARVLRHLDSEGQSGTARITGFSASVPWLAALPRTPLLSLARWRSPPFQASMPICWKACRMVSNSL